MDLTATCRCLYIHLTKTGNQQTKLYEQKQPVIHGKSQPKQRRLVLTMEKQLLLQIKFIVAFLLAALLQVSAKGYTQDITINRENVSLQTVFKEIERQSDYRFFYNETLLQRANKVTIQLQHASLEEALNACFKNQPLFYTIIEKTIIVKRRVEIKTASAPTPAKLPFVKGKITDDAGPVAGATVSVKQTNDATTTNERGEFTLTEVEEYAILVVSSVSHQAQEIAVNGKADLNITLSQKINELDESVVVAYTTTTQRRATGSFTVVKGETIQNLPNRSFDRSLQGMVPGLLVTSGNGQPGGGVSNFVLRGIATAASPFDGGSIVRNPLIVIDGIPVTQDFSQLDEGDHGNPLAQFNPSDIESISVLKDAAAVALYGSRASNGVILVTTKKGRQGKTIFSFRHQTDISSRLKGKIEVLNQAEYLELLYESYKNSDPTLTDADIKADLQSKFPVRSDGSFYQAPGWFDELFADNATTFSNELSMSGGNEKNSFYLNLEYTKQNGIIKKSGYDRKSIRFNFENRPVNWLKIGLNSTFSYNVQDYFGSDALIALASYISPLNPIRLEDNSYQLNYSWGTVFDLQPNLVAAADYNTYKNTSFRGLSKLYGEFSLNKNFKFTTNVGVDFMLTEAREKADPRLLDYSTFTLGTGRIEERNIRRANLITTNLLQFDKTFNNDHTITAVAGQEAQILSQKDLHLQVTGLGLPYYNQISSPGVTLGNYGGLNKKETLLSVFGQANYGFKNKYFFSASLRRDGSSRFGDHRRYGTYWSTGVGWVISDETFMQVVSPGVNYLKLRGSIGAAGNAAAINALTRYDQLYNVTFLNNTAVYPTNTPGSPEIQWEQTFTWDVGFEAQLVNKRVFISADFYKRNTTDLVYEINLAQNTGYFNVLSNIGKMENKGIELSVSADIIKSKSFRWSVNANWSTNQNTLTRTNVPFPSLITNLVANKEGENFNSFYMVRWAGVNSTNGLPQWFDSTGKANSDYSAAKKEFVGKPQPDGFGSITQLLSYRGFEFSATFYYQYGFQIYNSELSLQLLTDGTIPYINQSKEALNRWQKPGDIATNPRRTLNNISGANRPSTRYLFDGDFIRLKNVILTYNFPKKITDLLRLSKMQVFAQCHNLALWTKFPGRDPGDVNVFGNTQYPYPSQRSFSIGLNASFK